MCLYIYFFQIGTCKLHQTWDKPCWSKENGISFFEEKKTEENMLPQIFFQLIHCSVLNQVCKISMGQKSWLKLFSRSTGDLNEAIKWGAEPSSEPIRRARPIFRLCLWRKHCHFTAEISEKKKKQSQRMWFAMMWQKTTITLKAELGTLLIWGCSERIEIGNTVHTCTPLYRHTISQTHRSAQAVVAVHRGGGGKWDQIQREITDWGQWIDGWLEALWNLWVMVLHLIAFCVCLNYAT